MNQELESYSTLGNELTGTGKGFIILSQINMRFHLPCNDQNKIMRKEQKE